MAVNKVRKDMGWTKTQIPRVNKFKERFRELLADNNMNQTTFGKKYGISPNTVAKWCNGTEPSYDMLIFICKEFEESADYLLGLKDI